jgi:hypothetical protein
MPRIRRSAKKGPPKCGTVSSTRDPGRISFAEGVNWLNRSRARPRENPIVPYRNRVSRRQFVLAVVASAADGLAQPAAETRATSSGGF